MDLRQTFNEDEINYDRYRPDYPDELISSVAEYSGIHDGSRLLEIGFGTGQATSPFLRLGCDVTGIELGDRLCAFAAEKFRDHPGFHPVNADFMTLDISENSFDMIYSATAFHWLPAPDSYIKVYRTLKPGGTAALFWNHPFVSRDGDPSNEAVRRVYALWRPGSGPKEFSESDCGKVRDALDRNGFADVTVRLFRRLRKLSADEYVGLMGTYSDHRSLAPDTRAAFERDIRRAIEEAGGTINIYDTMDLYLARKPEI
ncbi:MAG: methyltransferase domain-containing protein [Clostridia bacterium]|nr:methyltransferase domain-containing protein [Clostridia bacterium]